MDSFKDPSKTNTLLPQQSSKKDIQKPLVISLIILAALIIAAIITVSTAQTIRRFSHSDNVFNQAKVIKDACSFTPYKNLCRSTLNSIAATINDHSDYPFEVNPKQLIFRSLELYVTQQTNLSSLPKILNSKIDDPQTKSVLLKCQHLFDQGMIQLNNLVAARDQDWYSPLGDWEVSDTVDHLTAEKTHLQACLDMLEDNRSIMVDEMRSEVQYSRKYVSNLVALLENIYNINAMPVAFVEDYIYNLMVFSNEYVIVCVVQYLFLLLLLSLMLRLY